MSVRPTKQPTIPICGPERRNVMPDTGLDRPALLFPVDSHIGNFVFLFSY